MATTHRPGGVDDPQAEIRELVRRLERLEQMQSILQNSRNVELPPSASRSATAGAGRAARRWRPVKPD